MGAQTSGSEGALFRVETRMLSAGPYIGGPQFNAELALASIRSKSWDRKNLKSKGDDVDHSLDSDTVRLCLRALVYVGNS